MREHNIPIDFVSGSSMGAYIGAHLARGITPVEMEEIASKMKDKSQLWAIADPVIPPVKGFFKGERAVEFMKAVIGDPSFEELEMPLYVTTFDLDTQEKIVINSGKVAQAVHASCAIPGVIAPVTWNGRRCSDGGVVDPVPVESVREQSDLVIAVSLVPTLDDIKAGKVAHQQNDDPASMRGRVMKGFNRSANVFANGNTVDTLRRSIRSAQAQIAHYALKEADIVICPTANSLPWHSFDSCEMIIEAGRQATLAQIPLIQEKLSQLSQTKQPNQAA